MGLVLVKGNISSFHTQHRMPSLNAHTANCQLVSIELKNEDPSADPSEDGNHTLTKKLLLTLSKVPFSWAMDAGTVETSLAKAKGRQAQ